MSGFLKLKESIFDLFDIGYSFIFIFVVLGFVVVCDFEKENYNVIVVIGDGVLIGGFVYEGFNNVGRYNGKFFVVLNDNDMLIFKNVGVIVKYLLKVWIKLCYFKLKKAVDSLVEGILVVGKNLSKFVRKVKGSLKYFFFSGILFEVFGFEYYGFIDGYDIERFCEVFESVKDFERFVLVYVVI